MFSNIKDALDWLFNQRQEKRRENLDRITRCIDLLGVKPRYRVIHIAGTNGKGSTASMIKDILKHTNKHVGFFTSPFVISFNERIQINDRYISDSEILHYLNTLYPFCNNYKTVYNETVSFFEVTLLMALMYFKDRSIDYAVIECGLGGRLDATNALKSDYQIITNIGYDHMQSLGNTLKDISWHKLGILKNATTLYTAVDYSLMDYFKDYCDKINCSIINVCDDVSDISVGDNTTFTYKNNRYQTNLLGTYQAYNASLAIEVCKNIVSDLSDDLINFAISNVFWPGRMECVCNNPKVYIDGAHNIHGINALCDSISNMGIKCHVVFTALHDKAYPDMIKRLDDIALDYVFTTVDDVRKTEAFEFEGLTNKEYHIIEDMEEALKYYLKNVGDDEIILVTGSLHFISAVRLLIKKISTEISV